MRTSAGLCVRVALAMTIAGAGTGTAAADPSSAPPSAAQQQADQLFAEGRALVTAGKPAEACEKFEAAIKLDPTAAGTMLNLGACYEQLDKPKTALVWFRKTQARASETNLPDYEAAAKEHTRQLAMVVPTIALVFAAPPPEGTRVTLDNEAVESTDYARVEIDPGHHKLDIVAPGKQPYHQELDVALKSAQTLTIALAATAGPRVDTGKSRRHLAYLIGGAGGVVWLGVLGYGLYERHVNQSSSSSTSEANDAVHNLKIYGTTAFVVGAAAIGVGAYLYFTAAHGERAEQTVIVPVVTPEQAGLALTGSF